MDININIAYITKQKIKLSIATVSFRDLNKLNDGLIVGLIIFFTTTEEKNSAYYKGVLK